MTMRLVTTFLLFAFILLAVFGMYLPMMSHGGHEGCLFSIAATAVCAPLAHIAHWQAMFIAIFFEILVLAAAMVVLMPSYAPFAQNILRFERYRRHLATPTKPTLFQELFANGILHPKEPSNT